MVERTQDLNVKDLSLARNCLEEIGEMWMNVKRDREFNSNKIKLFNVISCLPSPLIPAYIQCSADLQLTLLTYLTNN